MFSTGWKPVPFMPGSETAVPSFPQQEDRLLSIAGAHHEVLDPLSSMKVFFCIQLLGREEAQFVAPIGESISYGIWIPRHAQGSPLPTSPLVVEY
jgi:hypothetical protein